MTKQISLTFPNGAKAIADLNLKNAPVTAQTIWDALEQPVEVLAVHAAFAGPEIMTGLPESAQTFDPESIPVENQTCFPAAGDLLWYYQAPNQMKNMSEDLWEIGVFYGDGGRIFGPLGWTPCNIFASITEGLDEFAAACGNTRIDGAKTITIARVI